MYGKPWCRDGISVQDLSLQFAPHSGLDAWGREKDQPVLLSVSLSFRKAFDSAASQDALDESTMHYGILSKNLRSMKPVQAWETLDQLAARVYKTILDTPPGASLIHSCQIEIKMPKASLLGDLVNYVYFVDHDSVSRALHIDRIYIPTLIGLNANERTAKQKLLISVWINGLQETDCQSYPQLEKAITETIEPSSFETLESLAIHLLKHLRKQYVPLQSPGSSVRLRFEKPQAVPYAAAPVIEVFRTSDDLKSLA